MNHIQEKQPRSHFIYGVMLCALLLVFTQLQAAAQEWTTNGSNINSTNTGNVGIGTTTPGQKLEVGGNIGLSTSSGIISPDNFFIGNSSSARRFLFSGSTYYGTSNGNNGHYFRTGDAVTGTEVMTITGAGVGIGTATPSYRLHVVGNNTAAGGYPTLKLQNTQTNGHSWWLYSGAFGVPGALGIYDETAGSYRMFFDGSGNIGIGTASPTYKLQVLGAVKIGDSSAAPDQTSNVDIMDGSQTYALRVWDDNNLTSPRFAVKRTGETHFNGGNVGIGTTSPSTKLHVVGDATVTGNLNTTGTIIGGTIEAKYQDVAEWVPATHALPAGTVVTLNPARSNQVTASSTAYDTRVAGVISERPGLALGEAGKDKVLVATTGRVKVKVDATRAPIRIGDLLVTSDKEGVAMKSEPVELGGVKLHRPGTLIGKALESLEKGIGEILVLLSLQ